MPTVWMLVLCRRRQDIDSINTTTQVYPQLRMAKLNDSLRDLRLATLLLAHRLGQSRQREYRNLLGLFDD